MTQRLRRTGGAIGIGLTWAVAWNIVGSMVTLGFVVNTGSRPDPPFPLMFAAFGFIAGLVFSGVIHLAEGRRPFEQMSLPRFAAWGGAVGVLLATVFFVTIALSGDPAFLWNLLTVGPIVAGLSAATAAGSLALARRAQPWRNLFSRLVARA